MAKTLKSDKESLFELLLCLNKFPAEKVGNDFEKLINARKALKKPLRKYLDDEIDLQEKVQEEVTKIHKEKIVPTSKQIQDLQKLSPLNEEQGKELNALSTKNHAYEQETRHMISNLNITMQENQKALKKQKGEAVFDHEDFSFIHRFIKDNGTVLFLETGNDNKQFVNYDTAEKMLDLLATAE